MDATATAHLVPARRAGALPVPQRPLAWVAAAAWLAVAAYCVHHRVRRRGT